MFGGDKKGESGDNYLVSNVTRLNVGNGGI